jgi:hypothetical protein
VPGQRVYASGSGSVGDRNGWWQTAQRMGPAAQLAREVRILRGHPHSAVMPLLLSLRPSEPARLMVRRCATRQLTAGSGQHGSGRR